MTPNHYDCYEPYRPEQWTRSQRWITNRCLFLINLKDKNNERFHGGDGDTVKQWTANRGRSFYPEYESLRILHPKLFDKALKIWANDLMTDQISYI